LTWSRRIERHRPRVLLHRRGRCAARGPGEESLDGIAYALTIRCLLRLRSPSLLSHSDCAVANANNGGRQLDVCRTRETAKASASFERQSLARRSTRRLAPLAQADGVRGSGRRHQPGAQSRFVLFASPDGGTSCLLAFLASSSGGRLLAVALAASIRGVRVYSRRDGGRAEAQGSCAIEAVLWNFSPPSEGDRAGRGPLCPLVRSMERKRRDQKDASARRQDVYWCHRGSLRAPAFAAENVH
jgi:hypothetical protein